MTRTASPSRAPGSAMLARSGRALYARFPAAVALAVLGFAFGVSAVVDLFDEAEVSARFAGAAVVCGGVGGSVLRRHQRPRATSAPAIMTMVTLAMLILAVGAATAHMLADATQRLDSALFEGMATISTTSMTGLDADSLPMGLHMFRALMQWVGGLGGILLALIVIPLVLGRTGLYGRTDPGASSNALITGRARGTTRVVVLYSSFTVIMVIAFAFAGMSAFESVAHAMGTVSTGGLSTRTGSLSAFGDPAVEWVAAVGMAVAGLNVVVVWWILRGERLLLRKSTELRMYVGFLVAASAALALWMGSGDSLDNTAAHPIRTALVTVTSAMSTTGFTATDWTLLANGAQALLLLLMSIGAMAGSAGGGFRYVRLLQAFGFARRELERQLHPSAVRVVRVNGTAVGEGALSSLNGYISLYFLIAGSGAVLIALGDSRIGTASAITLAVSALATAGPQLGETVPLGELGALSKLALALLMLLGRLSIYAAILGVVTVLVRASQYLRQGWHWRPKS